MLKCVFGETVCSGLEVSKCFGFKNFMAPVNKTCLLERNNTFVRENNIISRLAIAGPKQVLHNFFHEFITRHVMRFVAILKFPILNFALRHYFAIKD